MKVVRRTRLKPLYRHQLLGIGLSVFIVVVVTMAGSFALFSKTDNGNEYNVVQVGALELSYVDLNEEGNVLQLASSYPVSDATGSSATPYRFSVENTGSIPANYTIRIIDDIDTITADGCADKLLDTGYLRYKFDNGEVGTIKDLKTSEEGGYVIATGTLQPTESNIHEIRLWINETSPNKVLGTHFHGKVIIDIEQKSSVVTKPSEGETRIGTVSDLAFKEENLGGNCKTYNDGVDTFLVGQCSQNYVWYSGKLWRVVLKNNETGAVKMVTENAITAIQYNESGNTLFENSYTDQWLNQEFLSTLHDYQNYLVTDSAWDATLDHSDTPTRPNGTSTISRTVGLLNAYEYYTTYNNSDGLASSQTGYLNNNLLWYLITPDSDTYIKYVNNGSFATWVPTISGGIRPVINLKPDIQIVNGTGNISSPYRLEGDNQETIKGTTLLNTRYSGEYVKFNNELYRIVNIENNLIKITAVNKPTSLLNNKFHNAVVISNFSNADIKNDLETYYQGLEQSIKELIEPNTVWYLGIIGIGTSYKASICSTVDINVNTKDCVKTTATTQANIGLPRVGELFTSHISRNELSNFWTLNRKEASSYWYVNATGTLNTVSPSVENGARPSMYLKQNVVIAKNNTGDGTYDHPYDIELGS